MHFGNHPPQLVVLFSMRGGIGKAGLQEEHLFPRALVPDVILQLIEYGFQHTVARLRLDRRVEPVHQHNQPLVGIVELLHAQAQFLRPKQKHRLHLLCRMRL